ncbi:MAG: hemerythrin domain-containing protein [Pseudobdellovibrionaceae bacterium]
MLIYDALKKDHESVRQHLNELIMLSEGDENRRHTLIQQIRDELVPHSRAEESVFYNSLRAIDAAKDIVMHGYQEHMEAEALLRTLQAKDKIDADWKATAQKLKKALEHHIQEEEGKIFTVARQLFTDDEARMMAEAFEQLKPEVKEEGFLRTTLDMVANLMPPRFAASVRTFGLNPDAGASKH